MFDYDDDLGDYDESSYDGRDHSELDHPRRPETPSWLPRDAVIAWETTPLSVDTRYPSRRRG